MIKAVLFDLDNTLVDFMKLKRMCVENSVDAMLDAGLEMPRDEAVRTLFDEYWKVGIENDRIFQSFLERVQGDVDYRILGSAIAAYRRTVISYLEPYPHVVETLTELGRRGIKIGVVTDAPKLKAWVRICSLRLHYFLDVVVTAEDAGAKKPDEKPFRRALEELDLKPGECLMVGDWVERDIEGAKAVGMKTCLAKYGQVTGKEKGADYEIGDVKEILDLIRRQ